MWLSTARLITNKVVYQQSRQPTSRTTPTEPILKSLKTRLSTNKDANEAAPKEVFKNEYVTRPPTVYDVARKFKVTNQWEVLS